MSLELMDYVKVTLVSSVVSSAIGLLHSSWKNGHDRKRNARDAALTTAHSLEQYARDCQPMKSVAREAIDSAELTGQNQALYYVVGLPDFEFQPGIEWKWLNHESAVAMREFPGFLRSVSRFQLAPLVRGSMRYAVEVELPVVAVRPKPAHQRAVKQPFALTDSCGSDVRLGQA
jgi:hypothetical protein